MTGGRAHGAVLVACGDAGARRQISRALEQAGYATREHATAEAALEGARADRPQVAILDVCLNQMCGYELCRELRDLYGDGLPIVLTSATRTDRIDRVAGLLLGADDYIVRPFAPDELVARVRALVRRARPSWPTAALVATDLTRRELEILNLMVEGVEQQKIAHRLFISPKTVNTHTQNVFRKLGVHNRAQAVSAAYQLDLVASAPAT